jgi:hypothetical protein
MTGEAASARIIKVLPQYLDRQGRHTLSPSLYERDAYQAVLRKNPSQRWGMRFAIQWKARSAAPGQLKLRVELRTSKGQATRPFVMEQGIKPSAWLSRWSALKVDGEQYQGLGELIAWRVTLWEGERQVAEQRSFLW